MLHKQAKEFIIVQNHISILLTELADNDYLLHSHHGILQSTITEACCNMQLTLLHGFSSSHIYIYSKCFKPINKPFQLPLSQIPSPFYQVWHWIHLLFFQPLSVSVEKLWYRLHSLTCDELMIATGHAICHQLYKT